MDPQNIPPQPQPVEPVLPKPNQSFLLPLIIGGILLILLVGLGAFYLVMKSIKNPDIVPVISPPITQSVSKITPTIIPQDETVNWKTYKNTTLLYQIKYPNNLILDRGPFNNSDEILSKGYKASFSDPIIGIGGISKYRLFIDVISSNNQCLTTNTCLTKFHYQMGLVSINFSLKNVILLNKNALRADSEDKFAGSNLPNTHSDLFVLVNGNFYHLELESDGKLTPEKIKLFNQILSTFKLLDQSQINLPCKKEGESICINSLICPNAANDKCCKGLFAVIQTKSNAICQKPSNTDSAQPRVNNLEQ